MSDTRPRWIAFAFVPLATLLVAGSFFWWQHRSVPKPAPPVWSPPPWWTTIPAMVQLRHDLKGPLPQEIVSDKTLHSLLVRIGRSLDGSGSKNEISTLLANWEVPERLNAQATAWRNAPREWRRLADELEAAANIDLEGETSIIGQLQKAIQSLDAGKDLEGLWEEVTLVLKDLTAANNRLLPDFTPWAMNEILTARGLADGLLRARGASERLREILTFQRELGSRVVWTRFEKEVPEVLRTPNSELMPGWPGKWKQEAQRFVGPTDGKRAEWNSILSGAETRIQKLSPSERTAQQQKLTAARTASAEALETDVAAIDRMLTDFKGLRLPSEQAHEKYAPFLAQWRTDAARAETKTEATQLLAKFQAETRTFPADYLFAIRSKEFEAQMRAALMTPDKLSLIFSQPDWEMMSSDAGTAVYKYRGSVAVPFLALGKTGFAMSAIEIPLSLAKLSGVAGSSPGMGPQIRKADFSPEVQSQWLWKGSLDFMRGTGLPNYFAPGVLPGDVGSDAVPATWLSFDEAKGIAAKLGGQLPTAAQWSAALGRMGTVRRLRSSAWTAQNNLVLQWSKTSSATRALLPDVGSFSKQVGLSVNSAYISDISATPGATDDHAVWLKSVFPPGGWKPADQFHHLIGNAAEWVDDNGKPAVMGGSVVSPPSLPVNTPLPIRTGAGAFDVTFRLVVRMGEGGEGVALAKFKEAVAEFPVPAVPAAR